MITLFGVALIAGVLLLTVLERRKPRPVPVRIRERDARHRRH